MNQSSCLQASGAGNSLLVVLASALQRRKARQHARMTTRQLAKMSDRLLKDIGLMRDRTGLLRDPVHLLPDAVIRRR